MQEPKISCVPKQRPLWIRYRGTGREKLNVPRQFKLKSAKAELP
ncbi:hypothetical protein M8C21_009965 [Ambrosia artemisiifolia]|uniref:Uncharacterized protein n=1 Tax=Ambrosia artemisiifolia TaxID=4212 RepID=A0AAD5CLY4_AMBAR|nr:hypothetical protein M8C21_009965 [Ambrosia artemisiifolia]